MFDFQSGIVINYNLWFHCCNVVLKAQTEAPVPSSGKIDDAASKTGGEMEFPADSDDDLTGEDVFRPPKPAALSPSGRKSTNKSSKTNQVGKSTSTASILISRAKRAAEVSPSSPTMVRF